MVYTLGIQYQAFTMCILESIFYSFHSLFIKRQNDLFLLHFGSPALF